MFTMRERANLTRIPPLLAMLFIEIPKLIHVLQPGGSAPKDLPLLNWCKLAAKIPNHEIAKICGLSEAEVEKARRKADR